MSELTRVDFYILPVSVPDGDERARARYACRLAEKAYKLGNRIHVRAASAAAATEFDELLWTFRQGSFVPHEIARAGTAPQSPVTIGAAGTVPPDADLLINLADTMPENPEGFPRVAEIVGGSEASRAPGRERYRAWKAHGVEVNRHDVGGDLA